VFDICETINRHCKQINQFLTFKKSFKFYANVGEDGAGHEIDGPRVDFDHIVGRVEHPEGAEADEGEHRVARPQRLQGRPHFARLVTIRSGNTPKLISINYRNIY
jgi:hypothetical protein